MFTDASARVANLNAVFACVNDYNTKGDPMLLDWLVTDEEAIHTKLISEYQALKEEYARQDEAPPRDRYAAWRVGSRDVYDRYPGR
jgi:hypothetical protein